VQISDYPIRIVSICGSLRRGSFNRIVANALPTLAPADMEIIPAPSFDDFPLYNTDLHTAAGFPETVLRFSEAIINADGVIFVTPEYNFSIPGALKNALDWISRLEARPFANKPVAIQSAATGPVGGARVQYHLRQVLVFMDAIAFTRPEVFISFVKTKVDEVSGQLIDQQSRDFIRAQLAAFAPFVRKMNSR
jgi:chromate reductase, NAD(P)H dehydrogenase (quinone)